MSKAINVGVVGAGCIANSVHFPSLKEIDGVDLCAVCDVRAQRAEEAAKKYGFKNYYSNHLEMLGEEKLDCVFLLVQPDQTFRLACDALNMGVHTFVEKPAGLTSFQTESLERLSKQTNRILQVGMNRRFIPLIQVVLSKMREITPITQIEGCFVKHGDASFFDGCGSAYICDTIHAIDLLSYIAQSEADTAATIISRVNSRVDNAWNAIIRFQNGITGILKANYQTGGRVHSFEIHGPEASAYIDIGFGGESCKARILHRKGSGSYSLASAGDGGYVIEELDGMKVAGSQKYYRYYGYYSEDKAFIESVRNGTRSISDIEDSVKSMRLAELLLAKAI